jgi:hypothetical protein
MEGRRETSGCSVRSTDVDAVQHGSVARVMQKAGEECRQHMGACGAAVQAE